MKKFFLMAAFAALTLASCNNEAQKVDAAAAPEAAGNASQKIAYVEIDSIMTQYTMCKNAKSDLEKKGKNIESTLANKQQNLENAAAKFQQDIQANKYTQQQAQNVQAGLQKQSQDLQALQQRLSAEFAEEEQKFNAALADSIHHFIDRYNKQKGYAFIFSKQGDNILYAGQAYNITDEVIKGLNKEYKPAK